MGPVWRIRRQENVSAPALRRDSPDRAVTASLCARCMPRTGELAVGASPAPRVERAYVGFLGRYAAPASYVGDRCSTPDTDARCPMARPAGPLVWSGCPDLNWGPRAPKARALARLSYTP